MRMSMKNENKYGIPSGTNPVIRQAKPLIIIPAQRVGRLPTLSVT